MDDSQRLHLRLLWYPDLCVLLNDTPLTLAYTHTLCDAFNHLIGFAERDIPNENQQETVQPPVCNPLPIERTIRDPQDVSALQVSRKLTDTLSVVCTIGDSGMGICYVGVATVA